MSHFIHAATSPALYSKGILKDVTALPAGEQMFPQPMAFGPFLLARRIAIGGSAEVFLAHRQGGPASDALVIKRLLPARRGGVTEDVLAEEARIMSLVRHPNVVRVYGAGAIDGEPFIAMEYVDGLDLQRVIQRSSCGKQSCPPELAAYIVRNIAEALHALHTAKGPRGDALGTCHGDVCPSNIYLSVQGSVKLGDFGIARVRSKQSAAPPQTTTGHVNYLAPEQLTGDPIGTWSDTYSLGVVLAELLIGEPLFSAGGQLATMLSIRDGRIEPLRRAAPSLPKELLEICERAIARDPSARYVSADAFAQALLPCEAAAGRDLRASLASWVSWAKNNARLAVELEQHVRESVGFMRAVRTPGPSQSSVSAIARQASSGTNELRHELSERASEEMCRIRRSASDPGETLPVSRLIELLATGYLSERDEVSFNDAAFVPLAHIPELGRHVLPSTTAVTSVLFTPGPPDYVADFSDTPFLRVLAKIYNESATGSLFVLDSVDGRQQRKDLYFRAGRLVHVASSDRQELLGEYLVGKNLLSREQLRAALAHMTRRQGQLGESLIALRLLDPVDVFNALRNQGRDRVASLCGWQSGTAHLYRSAEPEHVLFPLDLELSLCMVKGAEDAGLAPLLNYRRLALGPASPAVGTAGSSVPLLNIIPSLARKQVSLQTARAELANLHPGAVSLARSNACLVVAEALDWVRFIE